MQILAVHVPNGSARISAMKRSWRFLVSTMVFINTEYWDVVTLHMAHHRSQKSRPQRPWSRFPSRKSESWNRGFISSFAYLPTEIGMDLSGFIIRRIPDRPRAIMTSFLSCVDERRVVRGSHCHGRSFRVSVMSKIRAIRGVIAPHGFAAS